MNPSRLEICQSLGRHQTTDCKLLANRNSASPATTTACNINLRLYGRTQHLLVLMAFCAALIAIVSCAHGGYHCRQSACLDVRPWHILTFFRIVMV